MDGKFIAYYRVSTDRQGMNGNGMAAQRKAVEDYLNGGRWKLAGEFTEVESGKRSDRPELERALTACRKHKAKLVIAKLDRLSRNVHFISGLMERKVDFVACDMPSANAFMITWCRSCLNFAFVTGSIAASAAAAHLRANYRRYSDQAIIQKNKRGLLRLQGRHCLVRAGCWLMRSPGRKAYLPHRRLGQLFRVQIEIFLEI
jgi:DNA invertase Pin-like site-specific DNA recombinase